jgi:hypothetical protein
MLTDEIPEDVKCWTAKQRQAPDCQGQSLNKSFQWPANTGPLHFG